MERTMNLQSVIGYKAWLGDFSVNSKSTRGRGFESRRRNSLRVFNVSVKAEPGVETAPEAVGRGKRPQNKDGEFYVDTRCIDCGACCWMAPRSFSRVGEQYAVYNQPVCAEERLEALQATVSCPTASIHTKCPPADILQAQASFPLPINMKSLHGVYYCGYHSEKSNGTASYLIVHPKGNILVDSPRYTERLAHNIERLGGVRYMFLTYSCSVADHAIWAKRLRCDRIMHIHELDISTADTELMLEGQGPWSIFSDFDIIFTPGHTKGSVSLFYKPLKALFTGDCLPVSVDSGLGILEYNNHPVTGQLNSIRRLIDLDFLWILPGHGGRIEFKDLKEKKDTLEKLLASGSGTYQVL